MSGLVSATPALPSTDDPSQLDSSTVEHQMAEEQDTDDDLTESYYPQLSQPQPQPHVKRYSPPKPDANTFETQQAFLDSLKPMKIEDVVEGNRKCPICWKLFGEDPDPGFDNSELPVQLRCKHIFGNKCLSSVFGVRPGCGITLQPLQFSPDKKGRLLGELLLKYHQQHGSNFRDEVEMFENLLQHPDHHSEKQRWFGAYWTAIIHMILHQNYNLQNITFMENAVILDHYMKKPPKNAVKPGAIQPPYLADMDKNVSLTLASTPDLWGAHTSSTGDPYTSPLAAQNTLQSNTHALQNASSIPSDFAYSPPPLTPGTPQTYHSILSEEVKDQFLSSSSSSDPSKTWQIALANETNLDKLSALQKQFSDTKNAMVGTMFEQKVDALKMQAAREEQRKQEALNIREAAARMAQDRNTLLARKLTDILAQYKTYHTAFSTSDVPQEKNPLDKMPVQIPVKVNIHTTNMGDTSYVIPPPWSHTSIDDEDEGDDEATASEIAKSTMVIKRMYCNSCIPDEAKTTAPTPSELTWKPLEKAPDDCPLCHKILFKKTSAQQWSSA